MPRRTRSSPGPRIRAWADTSKADTGPSKITDSGCSAPGGGFSVPAPAPRTNRDAITRQSRGRAMRCDRRRVTRGSRSQHRGPTTPRSSNLAQPELSGVTRDVPAGALEGWLAADPGCPSAQPLRAPTALPAAETGLRVDSKAQAEQVRSVAVERVGEVLGVVPAGVMVELDDALRLHLNL